MKKAEFVSVTPNMARAWLEKSNIDNRKKRRWWSDALCAAMQRGEWVTTHQGIAFTASGKLLDGQHRLEAVCKFGSPVLMLVVDGLDDAAFSVIDSGIKRTISDLTGLPKRTAEAARLAGAMVFGGSVTAIQCAAIAAGGLGEIHDELMEFCPTNKAYYGSAAMRVAAVSLVMDGHSKDYVFDVYRNLVLEHFSELPSSAQSLIRQVNAGKTRAGMSRDVYARGLKAMNPNNKNIVKIKVSDSEIEAAAAYGRSLFRRALASED